MKREEYLNLVKQGNSEKAEVFTHCDGCSELTQHVAEVLVEDCGEADCCFKCYMLLGMNTYNEKKGSDKIKKDKSNMKKIDFEYTLTEVTDKDYKAFYKANEEYEIPEELKEIIKSLGDK